MPGEFDIIRHHFAAATSPRDDVSIGIGDDAAVLQVPAGHELVACTDTLVAGRHFPATTSPQAIGHKALAVNLSDLAAMGAQPAWGMLSLTLPSYEEDWLTEFMRSFSMLAQQFDLQLVGGDTTRGPLSVTVSLQGFVPAGAAILRRGAAAGDHVYVTGTLGDAGLALQLGEQAADELRARLDFPSPRIEAGLRLRGLASAAIDISDGLLADLGHLLEHDGLGASIELDHLPQSFAFQDGVRQAGPHAADLLHELPLNAGDDYELCFTAPPDRQADVEAFCADIDCGCTRIGVIEAQPGIRCLHAHAAGFIPAHMGFDHFGDPDG